MGLHGPIGGYPPSYSPPPFYFFIVLRGGDGFSSAWLCWPILGTVEEEDVSPTSSFFCPLWLWTVSALPSMKTASFALAFALVGSTSLFCVKVADLLVAFSAGCAVASEMSGGSGLISCVRGTGGVIQTCSVVVLMGKYDAFWGFGLAPGTGRFWDEWGFGVVCRFVWATSRFLPSPVGGLAPELLLLFQCMHAQTPCRCYTEQASTRSQLGWELGKLTGK
ncbi:hypothetical protein OIU85_013820 [Salix viminalis]|uniref:Uncharacterized protein n=1 Tax=Salix viminalis TaxID=40686 RepID=A0A9Q0NMK9_SALVM|nr:hypothetical protein OIU85_013820 [Salix viminalis]